jgi:hypothetical protein
MSKGHGELERSGGLSGKTSGGHWQVGSEWILLGRHADVPFGDSIPRHQGGLCVPWFLIGSGRGHRADRSAGIWLYDGNNSRVNATTPKTELMKAAGKKSAPWGRGYFVCANSM